MKKKKITKSFSNLVDHRNRFTTFGDVTPSTVKPSIVKLIDVTDIIQVNELLINAEKFIKENVLPAKAFFDMNGIKLNVKSECEVFLAHYGILNNTEMLNEVLKLCKKYGLF
jgi:hypothetical protein